ncbi:MAG: cyclic nucleotide-binding domain-containing protein [Ideonella sp. MAG2]|nr:MAG: cyclic nucleotide-binding domain-containing protein [Ideonella sp. MAG2]
MDATSSAPGPQVPRPITDEPTLAAQAEALLRTPTALSELTDEEARCVVSYMRLVSYDEGALLFREGDQEQTGYMLLILHGDVTVESTVVSRTEPIVMSVLGPGSLIGEMGLLDGAPRAASCVASLPVTGAALSRRSLRRLMEDAPEVATKLLIAVSQRLAERLRESGRQQRIYCQLVRAMQDEIEALERKLLQVIHGSAARTQAASSGTHAPSPPPGDDEPMTRPMRGGSFGPY